MSLAISFVRLSQPMTVSPADYFSFNARAPFLYRPLLPALLSWMPVDFQSCRVGLNVPLDTCANVAALALDGTFLFVTCLCVWSAMSVVAERVGRHPDWGIPAALLALWMATACFVLPPNRILYYAYDSLDLAFVAVGVMLATRWRRRGALLLIPLTFLAAFNKETAVFIPISVLVFAFFMRQIDRRLLVCSGLAAIATPLAKPLSVAFIQWKLGTTVPANLFELQLLGNLRQLTNPLMWLAWGSAMGGALLALLLLPSLDPHVRKLRRVVVAIVVVWFGVIMVVGMAREMRLLAPLIPVVVLAVTALLWDFLGDP